MENWARYAKPPSLLGEGSLACTGAGEYRGAGSGLCDRRLRTHAALVVSEGSGWFSSRISGAVAIEAPTVIWLFPGLQHSYRPQSSGWNEHWVLFAGSATRVLDHLPVWSPAAPVVRLAETPPSLGNTFARLHQELADATSLGALRASATCYSWLIDLATATASAPTPDLVDAFTRGAHRQVSMESRARELGVGIAELRSVILAATGITPLQLLIETRLARAQSILVETDLDVAVVGKMVGFDDPAYFSRQFTKRRGSSPSMFRREQRRIPTETEGTL